ncbi:ribonuclease P protein component [candidate division WOR-3 bacterium]|nr:ribonuclease P protein component [candidate division WOR-3 bacterium]
MAETLARSEILRRRRDLGRLQRLSSKRGSPFLLLRCAPAADVPPDARGTGRRVAFLLPRGMRGAVARNRLKRRLREIYRRNQTWFPVGYEYLIRPKPASLGLSFAALREQVRLLAEVRPEARS